MRCGLIGRRLGHSYSCQVHHALADYSYELWELEPEELAGFLEKRDFAGINVTIPYKEQVIPYLDELSETARAIGAVNTVVNRNGRLVGDNTDLPGMLALIRRMRLSLAGKKVLILGHRRYLQDRHGPPRRSCMPQRYTACPAAARTTPSPIRRQRRNTATRPASSTRRPAACTPMWTPAPWIWRISPGWRAWWTRCITPCAPIWC